MKKKSMIAFSLLFAVSVLSGCAAAGKDEMVHEKSNSETSNGAEKTSQSTPPVRKSVSQRVYPPYI